VTRVCAVASETMAGDGDGVLKVVQLVAVEPYRFLRAPTEAVRPRRTTQRDALHAFVLLKHDFDALLITGRFNDMRGCFIARLHRRLLTKGFSLLLSHSYQTIYGKSVFNYPRHGAKLKSNFKTYYDDHQFFCQE
jgi:hypothetical protein